MGAKLARGNEIEVGGSAEPRRQTFVERRGGTTGNGGLPCPLTRLKNRFGTRRRDAAIEDGRHRYPFSAAADRLDREIRDQTKNRGRDPARGLKDPLQSPLAKLGRRSQRQRAKQTADQPLEVLVVAP